jgi:hypothetical protein
VSERQALDRCARERGISVTELVRSAALEKIGAV